MSTVAEASRRPGRRWRPRLLDEERRRQVDTAPAEPHELPADELPGVGEAEVPLRDVIRAGGAATIVVLVLLNVVDEFDKYIFQVLGPDIQRTFDLSDTGLTMLSGAGAVAIFSRRHPPRRPGRPGAAHVADRGDVADLGRHVGPRRPRPGGAAASAPPGSSAVSARATARRPTRCWPTPTRSAVGAGSSPCSTWRTRSAPPSARCSSPPSPRSPAGSAGWRWAVVVLAVPAVLLAIAAFGLPEPVRAPTSGPSSGWRSRPTTPPPSSPPRRSRWPPRFERLRMIKSFAAQMSAIAALGFGLDRHVVDLRPGDGAGLRPRVRSAGPRIISVGSIGGFIGIALGGRFADRSFREDPARVARLVGVAMAGFGVLFTVGINMPTAWLPRPLLRRSPRSRSRRRWP